MRVSKTTVPTQARVRPRRRPARIILRTSAVRALMEQAEWTVADLARHMSMDQSVVHRLLRGELMVGPDSIAGLLIAFDGKVSFQRLFYVPGLSGSEPDEDQVAAS